MSPANSGGQSLPDDRSLWPSFLSGGLLPPPAPANGAVMDDSEMASLTPHHAHAHSHSALAYVHHSLALDLSGARILGAFCGNVGAQDAMKGNPQFDPFLRQERRGEMRGQIPNRARARGFGTK